MINYARFILHNKCDLSCKYCFHEGLNRTKNSRISLSMATAIAKCLINLGLRKIRVTGGEPLLWEDLLQFFINVVELNPGLKTAITTNGTNIDSMASSLYKVGLSDISVSIPTIDREQYKLLTGHDLLPKVLHGLKIISQFPFKRKVINFVYTNRCTLSDFNDILSLSIKYNMTLRVIDVVFFKEYYQSIDPIEDILRHKCNYKYNTKANIICYKLNGAVVEIDRNPCNQALNGNFYSCKTCIEDYPVRITPSGYLKPCLLRNSNLFNIAKAINEGVPNDEIAKKVAAALVERGPLTTEKEEFAL